MASEHAQLHTNGLPPNYLWPVSSAANDSSDLTQLSVALAGPESTPFSAGLFTLNISIPHTYPTTPPTAAFKTKIFHPNVDPSTGAVCVDTLKRDWKPELKLYDVLVVISCLLISPNPASALNAEAGRLCEGDFAGFEKRARTWVGVHARCPKELVQAVEESRRRGDKTEDVQGSDTAPSATSSSTIRRNRGKRKEHASASEPLADSTDNVLGISVGADVDVIGTKISSTLEQGESSAPKPPYTPQAQQLPPAVSPPPVVSQFNFRQPANTLLDSFTSVDSALQSTFQWKTGVEPRSSAGHSNVSPWSDWQSQSHDGTHDETTPERIKRQKMEERRMEAAGGCLKRYNSGVFGTRKGLKRL